MALMPISRREGLNWATKACAALAFMASVVQSEAKFTSEFVHESTCPESAEEIVYVEPDTSTHSRGWLIPILVYFAMLHVVVVIAIRHWWCGPRSMPIPAQVPAASESLRRIAQEVPAASESLRRIAEEVPASSDSLRRVAPEVVTIGSSTEEEPEETTGDWRRNKADKLLMEFSKDELSRLCRSRRLPSTGSKSDLTRRFLSCVSRATDKQLAYMSHLGRGDHELQVLVADVESKACASDWLDAAMSRAKAER